jgi:DNA-binding NtrC family response regulator
VLLLGETGVGKGWLARQIHAKSPRARKPFFELNCAGLGRELLESELFGHLRGAFTNAVTHKQGLVEVAEGGTLFLDEIGTISQEVQSKLLGFLDDRTFRAVGGIRKVTADVRILAATNLDLRQAADQGEFRQDLYFRLNVIPIRVPPLRERRDEIPDLASTIVEELGKRAGRPEVALGRGVIQVLQRQDWPGNVRELRNALERALILSHGRTIEVQHLPSEFQQAQPLRAAPLRLKNAEKTHILRVLAQNDGNRSAAAKTLGISRSTLKRKLREWRVGD